MTHEHWDQLLSWHKLHEPVYPWSRASDPYPVWISETMLQQTVVSAVEKAYVRWLERFPTVSDLAQAGEEEVLRAWEGLGYYSRARNLHAAAKQIAAAGAFPDDYPGWRELPGVGDYTASALMSFVYNEPYPTLDANLKRILLRLEALPEFTGEFEARWRAQLAGILRRFGSRAVNLALMHLGQALCRPQTPRCGECPLARRCQAHLLGVTDRIPPKRARVVEEGTEVPLVLLRAGAVLMESPKAGRFQGQWLFPSGPEGWWTEALDTAPDWKGSLPERTHTYTKYKVLLKPQAALLPEGVDLPSPPDRDQRWVPRAELAALPVPSVIRRILDDLESDLFLSGL